jgi:hypothetical protein
MNEETYAEDEKPECTNCVFFSPTFGCLKEKEGIKCDGVSSPYKFLHLDGVP